MKETDYQLSASQNSLEFQLQKNNWLDTLNEPDYELLELNSEKFSNLTMLRVGLAAIAMLAIPTGHFTHFRINNERKEIKRSIEEMNIELPVEYILKDEEDMLQAQHWIDQYKDQLFKESMRERNLDNKSSAATAITLVGWTSLLAMNTLYYFKREEEK